MILGVGKGVLLRLKCMQGWYFGCVLFREVSSFQRLTKSGIYLGWGKVSCLERCPHFRG